jgi:signal recognition particle subunit SEC65
LISKSERIGNNIVIALDSTGIKVNNRGEWLHPNPKWNVRRKRISQDNVVAVDIKKKKIVSLDVTSEEVHDEGRMLKKETCR